MLRTASLILSGLFGLGAFLAAASAEMPKASRKPVPVIYSTDLFHPHDDPDDHFDLATLFAMPDLEVKAILLDLGNAQRERPGRIPVEQIFQLSGKKAPHGVGLGDKLKDPRDLGLDQPADQQAAVKLLMQTLREAKEPVTIISVGSVRQITAAFNREPALLREKVARIYASIGNIGTDQLEWNVNLDPQAYIGLLRSELPVYLMPCMEIKDPHATYWQFKQEDVLASAPQPLQNFFIYALQRARPDELDPLKALTMDLRPWHHLVWAMPRNMWSTMAFLDAAGRKIYKLPKGYSAPATPAADANPVEVYSFVPALVTIDDQARPKFELNPAKPNIQLSNVRDRAKYTDAMRDCLKEIFASFPVSAAVKVK